VSANIWEILVGNHGCFKLNQRVLLIGYICDWFHGLQEELERLQKRLAEAEAAEAARKKPKEEKIPKGTLVVEGLVIDEWVGVFQLNPFPLQSSVLTPSSCLSVNTSYCKELCGMFHVLHISWVFPCSPYFLGVSMFSIFLGCFHVLHISWVLHCRFKTL
jgi:hypothetical protein